MKIYVAVKLTEVRKILNRRIVDQRSVDEIVVDICIMFRAQSEWDEMTRLNNPDLNYLEQTIFFHTSHHIFDRLGATPAVARYYQQWDAVTASIE